MIPVFIIFGFALLVLGGILVWYAQQVHARLERLLVFLDAQDIDRRRARAEDLRSREVRLKTLDSFFKDTRAILGKLFALAEEQSPHQRETVEVVKIPASAPEQAAGLGRSRGAALRAVVQPIARKGSTTLASMPSVAPPPPRSAPIVHTREKCRACEAGFVRHATGGVSRCSICDGWGELDAIPEPALHCSSGTPA
jgi:hypothetical protein